MNCKPKPTITCGTTNFDTCITYTGVWPKCFPNQEEDCFRQNEFNDAAGNLLCALDASATEFADNIDLSDLSGCDALQPKAKVKDAIQELYTAVCDIKVDLNLPVTHLTLPACFVDGCPPNPVTLGYVLQKLLDHVCCDCSGT